MFWFPFGDFFALCFRSHVPGFFHRVPACSERFRFLALSVGNKKVRSFCVWNVFSHHPNLLGMFYLLLLFDRQNVVADAFGIRRCVQNFFWRIGEDLDPMIDVAGVAG